MSSRTPQTRRASKTLHAGLICALSLFAFALAKDSLGAQTEEPDQAPSEQAPTEQAPTEQAPTEPVAGEGRFGDAPQHLRTATAAGDWKTALAAAHAIRSAAFALERTEEKRTEEKGTEEKEAVEDEAVEDEAVEDEAVEDEAVEDEAVEDEAVEDEAVEDEAVEWSDAEARAILDAASILKQGGELADAARLARRVAAGTAGRPHFEAAAVAWQLARQLAASEAPPKDATAAGADAVGIRLLADAEAALKEDDVLYQGIQELILVTLGDSAESGDRLLQQMVDAGVHAAVARLIEFNRANQQWQARQLGPLEETLLGLRPALDSPRVAPVWSAWWANQYGLLLQEQGRYAEATEAHQRAVQLAAAAGRPEQQRTANDNLGLLALRLGDYRRARRLLEASLSSPRGGPETAARWAAEINYAKALEGDQEYGQAQKQLQRLLEQPGGDAIARATAANNLALSLFLVGDWDTAEQHWKSCGASLSRAFPEGHPYLAEVEINLAWLDVGRDDLASAVERLQTAAANIKATRGKTDPRLAEVQTYLARSLAASGRNDQAARLIEQAVAAHSLRLEAMVSALSARDRLALTQELRVHAESSAWPGSFDTFLELAPELQIPVEQQYAAVLRWKSLLQRAADRADEEDHALPDALLARRDSLRRQLHEEYFRTVSRLARARQAERIAQLEVELQDTERSLAAFQERIEIAEPLQPSTISEQLPAEGVLVDFVQFRSYVPAKPERLFTQQSAYIAFVTRPGAPTVRVDLGSTSGLDGAIAGWRAKIENTSPDAEEAGREVAKLLWQPLSRLVEGASTIQICPDGDLFQVPWAAIPVGDDSFLIDRVAVSVVPALIAGREPTESADAKPRPPHLLLVGGVDYGPLHRQWPDLPGTRAEIEVVAKAFLARYPEGAIERLQGTDANEAAILQALPQASHVHLATHGFYLRRGDEDPFGLGDATAALNSGLVLAAPAPGTGGDQFLTADELGEIESAGSSALWILSACETGLGRPQAGQGMVGLLAALDRAGARGTVASLWKVDDAATSRLMSEFYRQLWQNDLPPPAALRAAQLTLRHESGQQTAHPKYWAAFYFSAGSRKYR